MATDTVREIKNRLSINDVIAPYVKIVRAGRSMRGLCPFHKEKTPSFHVSPDRGTYHCFGCGEGGDIFSFIEKIEGVDFKGALTMLAEKAGVEIVYDPAAKESASRAERLREAMNRAVEQYVSQLDSAGPAYAYALSRGLTKETLTSWQIGYAKDEWRALLEQLSKKGFTIEELRAAGLVKEADGKPGTYYDRFRNRLMFPIKDVAGRTVAFTGRALDKNDEAKYLNSPETDLYHKSEILFGLDRAKDQIRTRNFAILVEGQLDLLHAHQAGFQNTVALSGTAFTKRHAELLKRGSDNLMLALDADSAGLTATQKSALAALSAGMHVKAVRLPKGKDPADVISADAKEFAKYVAEAAPVVDFFLAIVAEGERDPHKQVLAAERIVLPLIRAIQSPMERDHFLQSAARSLSLGVEAIRASLAKLPKDEPLNAPPGAPPRAGQALTRSSREMREDMLRAVVASYPNTPLAKRIEAEYARITEAPLVTEGLTDAELFKAEQAFGEAPNVEAGDELLHAFEQAYIRDAYQKAVAHLRLIEGGKDRGAIAEAHSTVSKLSKRLSGG